MTNTADRIFLSYAQSDRAEMERLRKALQDRGIATWDEVHELQLGDHGDERVKDAISGSTGLLLYLTPASVGCNRVQREIAWARETKAARPAFHILSVVRGLGLGVLGLLLGATNVYAFELHDGEFIAAVAPRIAQVLGLSPVLPTRASEPEPPSQILDLVLEFVAPEIRLTMGMRRTTAQVRVSYRPPPAPDGGIGARGIESGFREFMAPLGPIEAEDLQWYLERYPEWPFGPFRDRARKIEAELRIWGRRLFDAVFSPADHAEAYRAWRGARGAKDRPIERRITIHVDERGTEFIGQREAAAVLLGLPWELLADGSGYLFEGGLRARVRRRLPGHDALPSLPPQRPVRVLLVVARPEDSAGGVPFLDPRASTVPITEALAALGESVEITILPDGSFASLRRALEEAEDLQRPYQVVHFDGHGRYDVDSGQGQLCFEHPETETQCMSVRYPDWVNADRLGSLLRERRIPLFILEACQSATADRIAHASVAATLLRAGVASVVAMSHAVLIETTRRFIGTFYGALADGKRIGAAMIAGQLALFDNLARTDEPPERRLALHDWMVAVLFQEEHGDVRLFPGGANRTPGALLDLRQTEQVRLGELKKPPPHGFVGRGKPLIDIARRLGRERYLALVGVGGQGKTALAAEAARWLVSLQRFERAAFVCVDHIVEARAVLDVIGRQLVPGYSAAHVEGTGTDDEKLRRAMLPVKRALAERPTLIIVDNLESALPLPWSPPDEGTTELLAMLHELSEVGDSRLLVTSREELPEPMEGHSLSIGRLDDKESLQLLAAVLRRAQRDPHALADRAAAERLIDTVGGHARSLVLLGPQVAERGLAATADDVQMLMAELDQLYPDRRERSLIASVKLSLSRLPASVQAAIKRLSVFKGGIYVRSAARVLGTSVDAILSMFRQLEVRALGRIEDEHLVPEPALRVALLASMSDEARTSAEQEWLEAIMRFVDLAAHEALTEIVASAPLVRASTVDIVEAAEYAARRSEQGLLDAEIATSFAATTEAVLSRLGMPRALRRVTEARRRLDRMLPGVCHASYLAAQQELDRTIESGNFVGAIGLATQLREDLRRADPVGLELKSDRVQASLKLAEALTHALEPERAIPVLDEATSEIDTMREAGNPAADRLSASAKLVRAAALRELGRLDEAARLYIEASDAARTVGLVEALAPAAIQLGTIRLLQGRIDEAIDAYSSAREIYEGTGNRDGLIVVWHQMGRALAQRGTLSEAEGAFRRALAHATALGSAAREATILGEIAYVYNVQDRLEDAVPFARQAVEKYAALGDPLHESKHQANLGLLLCRLGRLDEARAELKEALVKKRPFGHAARPWLAWSTLFDVERRAGAMEAAAEARRQAIITYRAYREQGDPAGAIPKMIATFGDELISSGRRAALRLIERNPSAVGAGGAKDEQFHAVIGVLRRIADGERDIMLAYGPGLDIMDTVEISLLLERLRSRGSR